MSIPSASQDLPSTSPNATPSPISSSASPTMHHDDADHGHPHHPPAVTNKHLTRQSSGSIIVPRDHPRGGDLDKVKNEDDDDEVYDENDARAMSPRRTSEDLEKMSRDARAHLNE